MVTHGSWGYGHSKHHYKTCPFCYQNHQCTVVFYSHNFISLIPPMIKLNFLGLTQQKLGQTDRQTLTYLYLRITGKLPEIKNYILAFICTDSLITLQKSINVFIKNSRFQTCTTMHGSLTVQGDLSLFL